MIWSWSLATAQPSFSLEQHKRVEDGVESDIRAFIARKYPQTTDIYCQQLYTETIKAGEEMNVNFRCSTSGAAAGGEQVTQIFEGYLKIASANGFESWDELGGEIRSPEVTFQNGSRISAKDPLPPATPGETPETPAADEHAE